MNDPQGIDNCGLWLISTTKIQSGFKIFKNSSENLNSSSFLELQQCHFLYCSVTVSMTIVFPNIYSQFSICSHGSLRLGIPNEQAETSEEAYFNLQTVKKICKTDRRRLCGTHLGVMPTPTGWGMAALVGGRGLNIIQIGVTGVYSFVTV